jgi:hypothetical protein
MKMANIVFDKVAQKMIKDAVKHAYLVSTALFIMLGHKTQRWHHYGADGHVRKTQRKV